MAAHVGIGHAFERRPRLRPLDDAGGEIHFPDPERRPPFQPAASVRRHRFRRSMTSFSAVMSMIAPTIARTAPGHRDVSVVAVPADGSIGKHTPEFVDVGNPVRRGRAPELAWPRRDRRGALSRRGPRRAPCTGSLAQRVDLCGTSGQRDQASGRIPRPGAETGDVLGEPDALLNRPVRLVARLFPAPGLGQPPVSASTSRRRTTRQREQECAQEKGRHPPVSRQTARHFLSRRVFLANRVSVR